MCLVGAYEQRGAVTVAGNAAAPGFGMVLGGAVCVHLFNHSEV